jgi:hypothetical protein
MTKLGIQLVLAGVLLGWTLAAGPALTQGSMSVFAVASPRGGLVSRKVGTIRGNVVGLSDYVGDQTFHTRAYAEPSVLGLLGGVVISDLLIRPAGSIITIFGARSTGDPMHEYGINLIEQSTKVAFF